MNNFDWSKLAELKEVTLPLWVLIILGFFALKGLFK